MITFRTVQRFNGLGASTAGGFRPGFTPVLRPGVDQSRAAIDTAMAQAVSACGDPRLTSPRQRAFCSESFQAGLTGDDLIVSALAKDACAGAVDAGLIPVEAHVTCVDCATASIHGAFTSDQIPSCVAAGGPGTLGQPQKSFFAANKTPLLIGGGVAAAALLAWALLR
jgi:hypothetical protein